MPSKSMAQQKAAMIELKRRLVGFEQDKFRGMDLNDLRDLANTPTKGLPTRAEKRRN